MRRPTVRRWQPPEGQAVRADVPNYATGGVVVLNYELRAD